MFALEIGVIGLKTVNSFDLRFLKIKVQKIICVVTVPCSKIHTITIFLEAILGCSPNSNLEMLYIKPITILEA